MPEVTKKAEAKKKSTNCNTCRHQKALLKGLPCSRCHAGSAHKGLTDRQKGLIKKAEDLAAWRAAKKKEMPQEEFQAAPGVYEAVANRS